MCATGNPHRATPKGVLGLEQPFPPQVPQVQAQGKPPTGPTPALLLLHIPLPQTPSSPHPLAEDPSSSKASKEVTGGLSVGQQQGLTPSSAHSPGRQGLQPSPSTLCPTSLWCLQEAEHSGA